MKRQQQVKAWVEDLDQMMTPDDVGPVLDHLALYAAPEPTAAETDALIARLRPLVPHTPATAGAALGVATPRFRSVGLAEPSFTFLHFLRPTLRLFRPVWWLLSLAAVALGLQLQPVLTDAAIPLSAGAPLLMVGAVAYGFRTLKGTALELELTCVISPAQAVLARLLVIMSYYLALGAATALATEGLSRAVAAPAPAGAPLVLLGWTASLVFFAGLALLLTLLTGTVPAMILSLSAWGLLLALRQYPISLFAPSTAPGWLFTQAAALGAGMLLIGLSLTGRVTERIPGRRGI